MRLALLTNLFPTDRMPSGGIFVRHRTQAHEKLGNECTTIALQVQPPEWIRAVRGSSTVQQNAGFTPVRFDATVLDAVRIARRKGYPARTVERAVNAVLDVLPRDSYDLLVAHGMFGVPAAAVARGVTAAHRKPWVPVLHGSDVNSVMPRHRVEYADILNAADGVVFVSSALEKTARKLGFVGENARVIPNGVDREIFEWHKRDDARRALGIDPTTPLFAYVGTLNRVKGADRLPAIAAELARRCPSAQLLVVGDGPESNRLRTVPSIRMLGQLPPEGVARAMAAADVLLMPSRNEGWPCVVFEAFSSGTPVVATAVGGVPEALSRGGGRLVPDDGNLPHLMVDAALMEGADRIGPNTLRSLAEGHDWASVAHAEAHYFREVMCSR